MLNNRNGRKVLCLIGALMLALQMVGAQIPVSRAAELPPVEVTARAALLIDTGSEELLYQRNIHEKEYPASLTKIMTTLLALEYVSSGKGKLDDKITASKEAVSQLEAGSSTQNIKEGEILTLEELLYCTMVSSANEACNVIAEYVAGSIEAFVALMNNRAKELGTENTHFVNTHGLHDDEHYTTAYDMYLITREALKHPEFMTICNTAAKSIAPTNKTPKERALYTTNYLISTNKETQYVYYPAKGIKTGNTSKAGHCLISSAEKEGLYLISVVLGAGKKEDSGQILSFVETKRLFEWGFANFTTKTLISTSEQIAEVKVSMGKDKDAVTVVPEKSLEALVPAALENSEIEREVKLFNEGGVTAPVTRGQKLGEITLSYGDRTFGTIPLVASYEVKRDETEHIAVGVKDFITQDWVKYTVAGVLTAVVLYIVFVIFYNRRRRKAGARGNYKGKRRRRR